ncbi:hypothetical protein Sjap_002941 [Stephania japonica]|uniref:Uncharacterized protein n=1 Tax=Stephania japonica TaxID=461633 RepID=A0AAP0KN01_9MAGN
MRKVVNPHYLQHSPLDDNLLREYASLKPLLEKPCGKKSSKGKRVHCSHQS